MTTARHAEAERSPRVSTQNFVPTPSPIRPPVRRIWASLPLASSPQVWTPLTALRFRSVRYCIVGLLPDAPSRVVRSCERPCLVDDGFPPSGPQEDLTTYMSHLVVLCACRAHQGFPPSRRRCAALTRAMRSRCSGQLSERQRSLQPSTCRCRSRAEDPTRVRRTMPRRLQPAAGRQRHGPPSAGQQRERR